MKKINKMIILASFCAAIIMIAAGCRNTGSPVTPGSTVIQEPGSERNSTTRTVSTVKGDVEVPVNPKRIIVDYLIGDVVSLGVEPLGVAKAEEGGENTAFADKIMEAVEIESWNMDPEEIMALEPDLIILAFSEGPYESLSKIAPTIYVPYGDMTVEERIHLIGEALNKTEEAEAVLNAYEEKIEKTQKKLQDAGLSDATITIGQFGDSSNFIAGAKHAVGVVVYKELGVNVPKKVQTEIIDADEYWGDVSMEVLESYCGDYIISLGEIPPALSDNAVWKSIPAVQNDRIINVGTAITWYTDIMSSGVLIDIIVESLIILTEV